MSRVATNYQTPRTVSTGRFSPTPFLTHSPSAASSERSMSNAGAKTNLQTRSAGVPVRSAAAPVSQKETVHMCPLCNVEYKDPRVLPCTHTFCFNCIRDKLIDNNQLTCPKCNHQVQPFDESELNSLPPNLILSQVWRMTLQHPTSTSLPKNSLRNQSTTGPTSSKMPDQQDKRKASLTNKNGSQTTTHEAKPHGIAAIVNALSRSSGSSSKTSARSSRSSSISSAQPMVSNLMKIYSEATAPKPQQKPRGDSVTSSGKHDELVKIFEQATKPSHQKVPSSSMTKRPSEAVEEVYQDVTWDTLVNGKIPEPPPFPNDWQSATETRQRPFESPERPISATISDRPISADVTQKATAIGDDQRHARISPTFRRGLTAESPVNSRPSTSSRSQNDFNDYESIPMPTQSSMYATVQPRDRNRLEDHVDSVRSSISSTTRDYSPARSTMPSYPQERHTTATSQQNQRNSQAESTASHILAVAISPRRSPDRYATQGVGTIFFGGESAIKQRTPSATSLQSSVSDAASEQKPTKQTNLQTTDRLRAPLNIPHPTQANNLSRFDSQKPQNNLEVPSPIKRTASKSVEHESSHAIPASSPTPTTKAIASRIELLSSDQKRIDREIEERRRRLQHDYDDLRKQMERKDLSTHNAGRTTATNFDRNLVEYYHGKQKVYADLAADTDSIGTELQHLKSAKDPTNNKQETWDRLERIANNLKNISRTIEQQKELRNEFTFTEGQPSIESGTKGQTVHKQTESQPRLNTPTPLPTRTSPSRIGPTPSKITPFKYAKFDHLSTLEPEAIGMTENNKIILLGICNKLFILNDHGELLRTVALAPSIRGITLSKKYQPQNIAYISHDEIVSMVDVDSGQILDCVKETDSTGESGTFLPLGIDTDSVRGNVYVCDYRNSCVIKFDDKLEFITQWRVYNHSDQYEEARPKLISVNDEKLYIIVEHSGKAYHTKGIAYTFSLHICDANSGNIIKIVDADTLGTQRLRWPCSVKTMNNGKCYILDTMTSGKYFSGQWQKHWSRVLEVAQDGNNIVTELFELDSEAATMAMTKQNMLIAANGEILFIDLGFLFKDQRQKEDSYDHDYQNLQ